MLLAKRVFFAFLSLFLIYQSYQLLNFLCETDNLNISITESFFIAFLINLFITGVFAFPGFIFPTYNLLPQGYYTLKHPNALIKWYTFLGVKFFTYLLLFLYWGKPKNKQRFFNGRRSGLRQLIIETKRAEFGHAGAFLSISLCCVPLITQGYWWVIVWGMLFNIIGNLYPVILQRHHRSRILRITK